MSNVHDLPCTPDLETMRWHLRRLFERAEEGLIEIAWTSPSHPHALNNARMFDLANVAEAAAFACEINQNVNRNVYAGVALRKEDAPRLQRGKRSVTQAVAAFKVDCDKEGQLAAALDVARRMNLSPNYVIYTGQQPHLRGQAYWLLDEPCADLDLAERVDAALAARLGTDSAVIDAPRVMRIPGSVAWPLKAGRTLEMTGLLNVPVREDRYTADEVVEKLRQAGAIEQPASSGAVIMDFNLAKPNLDLQDYVRLAWEPTRWHDNARDAVAYMVANSANDRLIFEVLIPALTMPGYTPAQTRSELVPMIVGARRKGYAPAIEEAPEPVETPAADKPASPFLTIDEMLARPPVEWLIDGHVIKQGVSVLWGASATFKSFIALDLAMAIAHGQPWHGKNVSEPRPALYLCAEGQYGFGVRCLVWREHKAKGAPSAGFHVLPVPVALIDPKAVDELLRAIMDHGLAPGFIVIDTLAKNFGAGDENSTGDMGKFVGAAERLARELSAHVMVVHHTGKDVDRGERGAYALRGGIDTSIKVERIAGSEHVTVECVKMKDAAEFEGLGLACVTAEAVHPLTGEIVTSRLLLPGETRPEALRPARDLLRPTEVAVFDMLAEQPLKHATIVARMGGGDATRRAVSRALKTLAEKGMAENFGGLWRQTSVLDDNEENQ